MKSLPPNDRMLAMPAPLRLGLGAALTLALLGVGGCSRSDSPPDSAPSGAMLDAMAEHPGRFRDATAESGLDATYRNGEEAGHLAILESLGGGVALLDYDGDGLLDVFVPGGGYFDGPEKKDIRGHSGRLFKNLGGWRFR